MHRFGIACMPLVQNVLDPVSRTWTKSKCPICGRDCWETDTYKWAKKSGIICQAACTECAIKEQTK